MTIKEIKRELADIDVVVTDKLPHKYCLGYFKPDLNEILINQEINKDDRVYTLIHELIHKRYPEYDEPIVEGLTIKTYEQLDDRDIGYLEFICT